MAFRQVFYSGAWFRPLGDSPRPGRDPVAGRLQAHQTGSQAGWSRQNHLQHHNQPQGKAGMVDKVNRPTREGAVGGPVQRCSSYALFEGLDYLDLRLVYSSLADVAKIRNISLSTVSRRSRELLEELVEPSIPLKLSRANATLDKDWIRLLRLSFQQWRLHHGHMKILATFSTEAILTQTTGLWDHLPDIYLSAHKIKEHLLERRLDLMISSNLDLGGALIAEACEDRESRFLAVPLLEDELMGGLYPAHPLSGKDTLTPEDCQEGLSAAYPAGMAQIGASALLERGLWRFASRHTSFEPRDWYLDQPTPKAICYVSTLLAAAVPQSRELVAVPFSQPLRQTTYAIMLKELAEHPAVQAALDAIRGNIQAIVADSKHPAILL